MMTNSTNGVSFERSHKDLSKAMKCEEIATLGGRKMSKNGHI